MYKILGTDQKEYGPVSADVLRQWIADRRANAQTLIKPEGAADWKPLAEFPEFSASLTAARGLVSPPGAAVVVRGQDKGMAVTSLVLGILSIFFCFLTGIPAIITGHIAHGRAKRMPDTYGGSGMALAGLIIGYCTLAMLPVILLAGLLLPALGKAKGKAQEINCVSNMKQIGLAARIWSGDHNDFVPPDFLSMSNEIVSTKILFCNSDRNHTRQTVSDWTTITPANISYVFVAPGIKEDATTASKVVFRCPIHGHVGLGDGSVLRGQKGKPPLGY